jgi:hypothetical protein
VLICRRCTNWFDLILNQNAKVIEKKRKQKRIKERKKKKRKEVWTGVVQPSDTGH